MSDLDAVLLHIDANFDGVIERLVTRLRQSACR